MENMASKADLDTLERGLCLYTPLQQFTDLREDIADFVKKEDHNILARETDYMKKDLSKLVSKEEIMARLNVFNSEI